MVYCSITFISTKIDVRLGQYVRLRVSVFVSSHFGFERVRLSGVVWRVRLSLLTVSGDNGAANRDSPHYGSAPDSDE